MTTSSSNIEWSIPDQPFKSLGPSKKAMPPPVPKRQDKFFKSDWGCQNSDVKNNDEESEQVNKILEAEEAIRQARELTQGSMRFNHFTSGGTRRDQINTSTLRRISEAIANLFRIKKKETVGILDSGHDYHVEAIELIKFQNTEFLGYLRLKIRKARSRLELRNVFKSNQRWLAMVELAPPDHSHTLLPDELSKMLFKGVEKDAEIVINDCAIKACYVDEHKIEDSPSCFGPLIEASNTCIVNFRRCIFFFEIFFQNTYLVLYTLLGPKNLLLKKLRLRLRNGRDNCRTGIEYSTEMDRVIVESVNIFDILFVRPKKDGTSQCVRLFSVRVCILQQIDIPTWSNVRMASVLLMAPEVTTPSTESPTKKTEESNIPNPNPIDNIQSPKNTKTQIIESSPSTVISKDK